MEGETSFENGVPSVQNLSCHICEIMENTRPISRNPKAIAEALNPEPNALKAARDYTRGESDRKWQQPSRSSAFQTFDPG